MSRVLVREYSRWEYLPYEVVTEDSKHYAADVTSRWFLTEAAALVHIDEQRRHGYKTYLYLHEGGSSND